MRTLFFYFGTWSCLISPIAASGVLQTPENQNYIKTRTYSTPNSQTYYDDIQYYDGLGRPYLTVCIKAAPATNKDLILLTEYDDIGRKSIEWLPVPLTTTAGYTSAANVKTTALGVNGYADKRPFTAYKYENAPEARLLEIREPGDAFLRTQPSTGSAYLLNDSSDSLNCLNLGLEMFSQQPAVRNNGYAAAETLFVTRICDADGGTVYEFKNARDERILIRQKLTPNVFADTYFVYDNRGNLCFVLPPELSASLVAGQFYPASDAAFAAYAYCYEYDERNRCVAKKLPGAAWVYQGYDYTDKLILIQNGNLRSKDQWQVVLYDPYGRIAMSGFVSNAALSADNYKLQAVPVVFDPTATSTYCYKATTNGISLTELQVAEVHYYDDYRHRSALSDYFSSLDYVALAGYGTRFGSDANSVAAKGLETGSLYAALPDCGELFGLNFYYDDKGQVIQRQAQTAYGGVYSECISYNFTGNILARREASQPTSGAEIDVLLSKFSYNDRGHLLTVTTTFNGISAAPMSYSYDDFGRLISFVRSSDAHTLTTTRRYNIRNWLTHQQSGVFDMTLVYNTPQYPTSQPSFSGNISEWSWSHINEGAPEDENLYAFSYDGLSRLTSTRQYIDGTANDLFVEKGLTYDRNSNILSLQRYASGSLADNFSYAYSGNQLTTLSGTTTGSYTYDTNGNMTHDGPNNLDLTYNQLNLLEKVQQSGSTVANYSYLSDCTKLSATDADGNGLYYRGSLVYRKQGSDLKLESASFNGGRFVATASSVDTYYHITDHLGSVRAVVDSSGEVKERSDYYPFGLRWEDAGSQLSDNRYRYNGKEEQSFVNVPYTDYGARMYDCRYRLSWLGVDPLSGKRPAESVYGFCGGNPIHRIDSDGQIWDTAWDVINLVYDTGAAIYNHATGDHTAAKGHWVDAGSDLLAMAIPFVPAGATKIIKAGDKAVDAAKSVDKAADAAKAVDKVNDSKKIGAGANTDSKTAKEALGKAKDQNGVPRSQQPNKTIKPNTPEGRAAGLDSRNVKQYEYSNSKGEKVIIRQDKPATYPNGGSQPAHFNAGSDPEKLKQHHNYGN